jgi:hypothetical protein
MDEKYINLLDELMLKYSNIDYLGCYYSKLVVYYIKKDQLTVILHLDGMPHEHLKIIQEVVNKLVKVLPVNFIYRLNLDGWYCEVTNGNFQLDFVDGRYYIKPEHQEMHDRNEVATIAEIAILNNIEYTEFKWNLLKKKSIELGFTPVKDKNGFENLYLIEAFIACYPEYNINFKNELLNELNIEPKKKKFLGLF